MVKDTDREVDMGAILTFSVKSVRSSTETERRGHHYWVGQ